MICSAFVLICLLYNLNNTEYIIVQIDGIQNVINSVGQTSFVFVAFGICIVVLNDYKCVRGRFYVYYLPAIAGLSIVVGSRAPSLLSDGSLTDFFLATVLGTTFRGPMMISRTEAAGTRT